MAGYGSPTDPSRRGLRAAISTLAGLARVVLSRHSESAEHSSAFLPSEVNRSGEDDRAPGRLHRGALMVRVNHNGGTVGCVVSEVTRFRLVRSDRARTPRPLWTAGAPSMQLARSITPRFSPSRHATVRRIWRNDLESEPEAASSAELS